MNLLNSLIIASEKAANIARTCRQDQHLFNLLVQEKCAGEANPRFVHDFKTLADVLIQETLKHDVGKQFPELNNYIKGEENNIFSNKLGESIKVEVLNCEEDTRMLLRGVLNDDIIAATSLAQEVHKQIDVDDVNIELNIPDVPEDWDVNTLSIWIDPIDSTSEYISGIEKQGYNKIYLTGLRCVTVLIGVYDRFTGNPIIGVVNQPFYEETNKSWRGKCYWGINTVSGSHLPLSPVKPSNVLCVSSSEDAIVKSKLREEGYTLVEAAGAGYKLLVVILGLADGYVLTRNSTYKWDTCAPQAILNCTGGGLAVWEYAVNGKVVPVDYRDDGVDSADVENKIDKYSNRGGIIAYRNAATLTRILKIFSS